MGQKIALPTNSGADASDSPAIGIKDVEPGNRLIVTEGDASDEFTSIEAQWRVGSRDVARAGDVGVSVALVVSDQPRDLRPRRGKFLLAQLVVHRGIEASADLGPPGSGEIIDDRAGQLGGLRKWSFSCLRINWLAVTAYLRSRHHPSGRASAQDSSDGAADRQVPPWLVTSPVHIPRSLALAPGSTTSPPTMPNM